MIDLSNVPQDEMTPLERSTAYLKGEEVDRLPCQPMASEEGALFINKSVKDFLFDSDVMQETELYKVRELGYESTSISLTLRGMGECLGSELKYLDNRAPHVVKPVLTDYSMLDHMDLINPYKDGRAPIILEGLSKVLDELEGYCNIGAAIPGPISAAHAVRGEKQLLKDIVKDPENFDKLLDFMVENLLVYVEAMYKTNGLTCGISDPMCSTVLISPKTFKEKVFPHLNRLIDGIVSLTGNKPSLHICGKTKEIWPYIKKLNISSYSLDNLEDIGEAKKVLGDQLLILGNVDPVRYITSGTIEEVHEETRKCIEKGHDSPKGYFVSSGCAIPGTAPKENILALRDATKYYSDLYKIHRLGN